MALRSTVISSSYQRPLYRNGTGITVSLQSVAFSFQVLKEATAARRDQLNELEGLFNYLDEHRSLKGYDGEKTAR